MDALKNSLFMLIIFVLLNFSTCAELDSNVHKSNESDIDEEPPGFAPKVRFLTEFPKGIENGTSAEVECEVEGGHSNVTISFKTCGRATIFRPWCDWLSLVPESVTQKGSKTVYKVRWTPETSGDIVCKASNGFGSSRSDLGLCVSVEDSFEVPDMVRSGEYALFKCTAGDCIHEDERSVQLYFKPANGTEYRHLFGVRSKERILNLENKYHRTRAWAIDKGFYNCTIKKKISGAWQKKSFIRFMDVIE